MKLPTQGAVEANMSEYARIPGDGTTQSEPPGRRHPEPECNNNITETIPHRTVNTHCNQQHQQMQQQQQQQQQRPRDEHRGPRFHPHQINFQEAVMNENVAELEQLLEDQVGKLNVNLYDTDGQTALHHSCSNGNLALVKLLVKFGADTRLANRDGWNALHIAAFGGYQDISLYLININATRRTEIEQRTLKR